MAAFGSRMSTTDSLFSLQLFNLANEADAELQEDRTQDPTVLKAVQSAFDEAEVCLKDLLQNICLNSDFTSKYDIMSTEPGEPYIYSLTTLAGPYRYSLEAFPIIDMSSQEALKKGPEEFKFHEVFESAIERYTNIKTKPNAILSETRSKNFCYPVTLTIEAVPLEKAKKSTRLLLLREFQILVSLWEQYRNELSHMKCNIDHLVGFPMPFEFCSVTGTEYDIQNTSIHYYDAWGTRVDSLKKFELPLSASTFMDSTLSYMSTEKLGPSVTYLIDMLRVQSETFSLSSALMVYDQLICRLLVMHRYGVVHGDLNTDCLRFGSGNTCNVLYISDFSTSICLPNKELKPEFLFHDRFVSTLMLKDRHRHFVHDLESAYYIFLLLAIGFLPWDTKLKESLRTASLLKMGKDKNPLTDLSNTARCKEDFLNSPKLLNKLLCSKVFEMDNVLYHSFTADLMLTIHMKIKDVLASCSLISEENYRRDIGIAGSAANSAYIGLRKTIASYFHFDELSAFLKDPAIDVKIGMQMSDDPNASRKAWDLSSWCWNHIGMDPKPMTVTSPLRLSTTSD